MSLADQQWCPTSVQVTVLQARGLRIKGKSGTNDAYAVMQVGKEKYQTSVVEKSVAPVWKEEATFDLPPLLQGGGGGGKERSTLHVHVLHRALVGPDKLLGQAVINLPQLNEDRTRNKTEWFKLLDKSGKPDKDRGEVLVDIQFMRNNMTASMFDLSAAGKSRSRLGKFKDKVRGKKKELDSVSSIVPSFSQILTDSEDEANGDGEAASKDGKSKKHKMKSLFSHKSNLQRNMSQSMSVLPAKNSSLSGSQSSGLNVDSSEGKKKFKFMIHKRSSSSDSKDSSSGHQKQAPVEQSNLCINGSHIYCEEPQLRSSRVSSNFSMASSGLGSMEDVPENSPPSVNSLRAVRQYSPWMEEEEEEEEEDNVDGSKKERTGMEEHGGIEEEENLGNKEELEKLAKEKFRQEEEERRKLEEKAKREEEERNRKDEERTREERLKREEEEQQRLSEERRRKEEQERQKLEEEKRHREEKERVRREDEKRRQEERAEERRKEEEYKLAEEKRRLKEEEERRLEEEKVRKEEEQRRKEEERAKEAEEALVRKREADKMREREEEDRLRREEMKRQEEEERLRREEMERQEAEERLRREEMKRQEEEERLRKEKEEYERKTKEIRLMEERERIEAEKKLEEKMRMEEEMKRKEEEERSAKRQELEEKRRLEDQERKKVEQEKIQREEEERIRKEEEMSQEEEILRRQQEELERLAKEKLKQEEEERRRAEEEKLKREEEERMRKEEEMKKVKEEKLKREEEERVRRQEEMRQEEEERARKEKEELERLEEEKERQEKRRKEEEERIKEEQEMIRKEKEEERARQERDKTERLAVETKRPQDQEKRIEGEDGVRGEERDRKERKGKEARKQEKENLTRETEEQTKMESRTNEERGAGNKCITSTNPFDENISYDPSEEISTSPSVPHSHTTEEESVQQRCQSSVSLVGSMATSTNEKDPITTQREKRPAPLPPGKNQAEKPRHKEHDVSTERLSQMNKQTKEKDVKTVSVLPQRSVQTITLQSKSPLDSKNTQSSVQNSTIKVTTAKQSRRPAPSRPSSVDEPSSESKTTLSSGKISHRDALETKQVQVVYGLNPFECDEDDDELIAQDDTAVSGNTGPVHWPAALSQTADKDASTPIKVKSSKIAHAPPPPAKNDEDHGTGNTGTAVPNNARDPQVEAKSRLHFKKSPNQVSQQTEVQNMVVGEEGPPPSSRRLQPVKPLNSPEQQSALVVKGEKDHRGVQDKTKVNDSGMSGPYSQLTQEELISLVLKQESQLSERDKTISELEQYIDNLLVRVIEEQPSILMSLSSLKKAA